LERQKGEHQMALEQMREQARLQVAQQQASLAATQPNVRATI